MEVVDKNKLETSILYLQRITEGKNPVNNLPAGCQTAHCGRGKPHFIFGGLASPIVPYRNLPQTLRGLTADCRSFV